MARCWGMPSHTFGAAYARFMGDRNFQADDRPPVRCETRGSCQVRCTVQLPSTKRGLWYSAPPHSPSSYEVTRYCPSLRFVDDEELAYVLTRMREVHDFWHVLFDLNTDVNSELAVKALEFVQV